VEKIKHEAALPNNENLVQVRLTHSLTIGNHTRAFSTWQTRTGSSNLSYHLRQFEGPYKELL